jgi:hypothetical protein
MTHTHQLYNICTKSYFFMISQDIKAFNDYSFKNRVCCANIPEQQGLVGHALIPNIPILEYCYGFRICPPLCLHRTMDRRETMKVLPDYLSELWDNR